MSSIWQVLQELGDLFCAWYDELDPAAFHEQIEVWSEDDALRSLSAAVVRDAERRATPATLRMRVDNGPGERQGRIFAALRGLDRVFAAVVPGVAGVPPEPWADAGAEIAIRGRLDSGELPGMLLPRLVTRARLDHLPEEPREAFGAVLRVSPEACEKVVHTLVPIGSRISRRGLARGVTIGCAPLVEDPDELSYEVHERGGKRFYRIAARDIEAISARIETVLDGCAAAGVQIVIVPELMLCPDLVEAWRDALRARQRRRSGGALRFLLIGSGDVDGGERPVNAALMLHARSGATLGRQDKLYPFNMDADQLARFGLVERLGSEPVHEDLVRGERLTLLDLGGMRIAILICEDLNRVEDLAGRLREFGVSHVLVPVFARASRDRRWERASADVHVRSTGAVVAISNSLVVPRLMGAEDPGTGLVTGPGARDAVVLRAASAADVVAATLHADGSVSTPA